MDAGLHDLLCEELRQRPTSNVGRTRSGPVARRPMVPGATGALRCRAGGASEGVSTAVSLLLPSPAIMGTRSRAGNTD